MRKSWLHPDNARLISFLISTILSVSSILFEDNSLDILNSYALKDKRFRIFSQENQGQGVARNKALELAQGKYVIFVDPDDWIEHDTLDEIYWEFKTTKSAVIEFNFNPIL